MKLEWATAHFGVGSQYNVLYHDMQGLGGSTGARRGAQWHATTRRSRAATRPSCPRARHGPAHAAWAFV